MVALCRVEDVDRETNIIFCGNPGVGKSTLLSSISNLHFESGISWGAGLTTEACFKEDPSNSNLRYVDTPGLADLELAEDSAKAIKAALDDAVENKRRVKIFFVATGEAGRVRPADFLTINKVMGSINLPADAEMSDRSFGIIINKCTFLENEKFKTSGKRQLLHTFSRKSMLNTFPTSEVMFVPSIEKLTNASNETVVSEELNTFVQSLQGIDKIESVSEIDVRDLEKQLEDVRKRHKEEIEMYERMMEDELAKLQAQGAKALDEIYAEVTFQNAEEKESITEASNFEDNEAPKLGDVVLLEDGIGIIRFLGQVPELSITGLRYGVELKGVTLPNGTDGSIGQQRYFKCPHGAGTFVESESLVRIISPEELLQTVGILNQCLKKCSSELQSLRA